MENEFEEAYVDNRSSVSCGGTALDWYEKHVGTKDSTVMRALELAAFLKDNLRVITSLVETGEITTEGTFDFIGQGGLDLNFCEKYVIAGNNASFVRQVANARPMIAGILERIEE